MLICIQTEATVRSVPIFIQTGATVSRVLIFIQAEATVSNVLICIQTEVTVRSVLIFIEKESTISVLVQQRTNFLGVTDNVHSCIEAELVSTPQILCSVSLYNCLRISKVEPVAVCNYFIEHSYF